MEMEISASKRPSRRRSRQRESQFCMVCLNTSEDCKLYAANTYNLDMEFEHLTGISLQGLTQFEAQFCSECAQRLSNCSKFRNKSLRAYQILMELVELDKPLTIQNIKTLCKSNNLASSISKKSFQPDYCDLNLIHVELQEQEKLQQELATSKPIKVQDSTNNELVNIQGDLLNIGRIKIEVKLIDGEIILIPVQELENKVESKCLDVMLNPVPEVGNKSEPKSLDDDFDINIDYIDDDNYSDIDTRCEKRINDKVDKFMNDVMNDTDNDCVVLKDSDSDNDSVSVTKTEIKINVEKERIVKPRRKRETVNTKLKQNKPEYTKYFNVTKLTREEQLEDIQKRKEKANYINGNFKCEICFKGFMKGDAYKTHMDQHTDKYGKSVCPICARRFRNDCLMRQHVTSNHSTRYSCLRCPLVTNHEDVIKRHARRHQGFTYTCPHCLDVLNSKSGYWLHMRVQHPTGLVCTQCGFSFINERGLRIHINLKHHNEDVRNPCGPLCERCDIRFASGAAYRQHLHVSPKHAADGNRGRNAPKLERFLTIVKCEECGEQLKGISNYRRHFLQAHPGKTRTQYLPQSLCRNKFLCEQCGKIFEQKYWFQFHKLKHSGKKQFQCDMCKRFYYTKWLLSMHMKSHSEQQPVYACGVCGKKFFNKGNRDKHLWTHEEQRPHPCRACDKSFVNASTLRSHVQHAHLKKPYPKKSRGPRQRASRALHDKEPVCGTIIWPQNGVASGGQSGLTYDKRFLAAVEPPRPLVDLQHD